MSVSFRKNIVRFSSVVLITQLFVGNILPVSAGLFSGPKLPSATSMFSDMEKRYHMDTGSIQNQGESLNVADNKRPTPQVTLFFSPSDPKPGEKLSAKAFPMYFSNKENQLYYTWYIKHAQCGLSSSPSATVRSLCDRDNDSKITIEDWKIEAMTILAQNGFDKTGVSYATDADDDGYKARFGGDNKTGAPDHCYVNDPASGKNYELLDGSADTTDFTCPSGTEPVCLEGDVTIDPNDQTSTTTTTGNTDPVTGDSTETSTTTSTAPFDFVNSTVCRVSGLPTCSSTGPKCYVGEPRCLADPTSNTTCGTALTVCSGASTQTLACRHLFPNASGFTTGDGTFNQGEEEKWGTNPKDPDTADNGNKDEANVVGLGQNNLTWNYGVGDQVGVVIEGTSMINTKYDDSSSMIMWAFSKNDCPISLAKSTGAVTKKIKGYDVNILTAQMDLNKCIERNLVDPTQGGQATNLDVSVSATPDNPNNDESTDESGDTIAAQASLSNASRSLSDILFDWDVKLSNNPQFIDDGGSLIAKSVTSDLKSKNLVGGTKGIALDTLRVKLDMPNDPTKTFGGKQLSSYLTGGVGYMKFTASATESFSSGVVRKGKSDVIVKFTSTKQKITAYKVQAVPVGSLMRVIYDKSPTGKICQGNATDPTDPNNLDKSSCRVIKNEIIGLSVDPTGLSDFKWTINGKPLTCTKAAVSPDCEDDKPNGVNFFPVTGDVGDTYTVTLTANDLSSATKSDKIVTLSRSFHVVKPELSIKSRDANAWAKLLGQYKDIGGADPTNCPQGVCPEYSDTVFQGYSGETFSFQSAFMPDFLKDASVRQWTVDGSIVAESGSVPGGAISFSALKTAPDVYNIALQASVSQPQETRKALSDIWSISQLDSPEIHFSATIQVELKESGFAQGTLPGMKKYLAAIASYIPASVMFSFRIVLAVILILFTANILFVLLPEQATLPGSFRRRND